MALKDYQITISSGVVYAIEKSAPVSGSEQLQPSIEVVGGSGVDIYGSQVAPGTGTPPANMFKTKTAFVGIEAFAVIPNYLYVSGTATTITLSGVSATQVV